MALTEKQARFVDFYIIDLDAKAAAKSAGYSEKTAYSIGSRLTKQPDVRAAIDAKLAEIAKANELSAKWVIDRLKATAEAGIKGDSVRALELLGKTMAMFSDKVEHTGADGGPLEFQTSPLIVHAQTGLLNQLASAPATSYAGSVDAAQVLSYLASVSSPTLQFENNGVTGVMLSNPYYPGTVAQQIEEVCRHADISFVVDNGVLAIWPKGGSRGGLVPLISADTGMIGYPRYSQAHIALDTEFNAQLSPGMQVQVKSIITPASGTWSIQSITHQIESEVPGGAWLTHAECWPPSLYAANSAQGQPTGE